MPTTVQIAYVLLALDCGAIHASTVLLLALWLRQRAARDGAAPDAAAAVTSAWPPGWNAPTAPHPTFAAADPWAGAEPDTPPPPLDLSALAPTPAGPAAVLPRRERRQRIDRPRNDPPAAADPPLFVELVLSPRRNPPAPVDYFRVGG